MIYLNRTQNQTRLIINHYSKRRYFYHPSFLQHPTFSWANQT